MESPAESRPDTRRLIADEVRRRPGISLNRLATMLELNWRTIQHHVGILAGRGDLHVDIGPWAHGVFDANVPRTQRAYLKALHDERGQQILATLLRLRSAGVPTLSKELGLSPKVVRESLWALVDEGVLIDDKKGHPTFRLAKPELAARLYAETCGDTPPR